MGGLLIPALWLAKVTAVLILAMALTIALRRASASTRYVVWLATLVVVLLVPAMSTWSPLPLRVVPSVTLRMTTESSDDFVRALRADPAASRALPTGQAALARDASGGTPLSFVSLVVAIWLAVAIAVLAWLLHGAITARHIVRRGHVLDTEEWLRPLYETADRLDLHHAPRMMMSGAIDMPFACGLVRPTIVLPTTAERWSDERRRAVLFHELAHIRRRDLLGHTLGRIACAAYWFHPLVWRAAKALRAESERACDDLVLAAGAPASDYADHLLDIVTTVRAHRVPATALPIASRKEFEGRMLAILDPGIRRTPSSRHQGAFIGISVTAVTLGIAAVSPRRGPVERSVPEAAATAVDSAELATPVLQAPAPLRPSPVRADASPLKRHARVAPRAPAATRTPEAAATSAAATVPVPADTALLFRMLRTDPSRDVRRVATWAVAGNRAAIPLLTERLRADDDAKVREMAAWALGGMPAPESEPFLSAALAGDRSADVRATAAWALGRARGRTHADVLERALGDESPGVRARAVWALSHYGLRETPEGVIALLRDSDTKVRVIAAWMLTHVNDSSTIPAVREAFLEEQNGEAQHAQFRALYFLGNRDSLIIRRAMESRNPDVRERAVRLLVGRHPGAWPWPWPWADARAIP